MKTFVRWYLERAVATQSVLCVGLDPTPDHVPPQFGSTMQGMEEYLIKIIELASVRAPVIKPQFAYYGAMGPDGISMLIRLVKYAHELGIPVILDAKRADIGETMAMYGEEVFGRYDVDACTFVPYLGSTFRASNNSKAWEPWLAEGKCAISMIQTSNLEAQQLQNQMLASGLQVYEHLAKLVRDWEQDIRTSTGLANCVAGVVGATYEAEAPRCRELAGDEVFFLIPGYGAQGGGSRGAVAGLPTSTGQPMGVVNSSRGLTLHSWTDRKGVRKAGDPLDHVAIAINAANADLNAALEAKLGRYPYTQTV